jgi:hypothetical protein
MRKWGLILGVLFIGAEIVGRIYLVMAALRQRAGRTRSRSPLGERSHRRSFCARYPNGISSINRMVPAGSDRNAQADLARRAASLFVRPYSRAQGERGAIGKRRKIGKRRQRRGNRRWIFGCVLVGLATPAIAGDARFSAIPVPSEPQSIWLLDTYTGALSRCEAAALDTSPTCAPWTGAQGEQALYLYDPETQKLIPE